jgi:hypothetical protein
MRQRLPVLWLACVTTFALGLLACGPQALAGGRDGALFPAPERDRIDHGTVAPEAAKLHLILLGDENDPGIGANCKRDVDAVRSLLQDRFARQPERLVLHDLTGDAWTPERVLDYLNNHLRIGPNENVLVFHSGHGGIRRQTNPAEVFVLGLNSHRDIARAYIVQAIERQRPRALILLTDCCSNYFGLAGPTLAMTDARALADPTLCWPTVQDLLLRTRGRIDITAAEPGTTALASHTGFDDTGAQSAFTDALLRLWTDHTRFYASWHEFFPVLRQETYETSHHQHKAYAFALEEEIASGPRKAASCDGKWFAPLARHGSAAAYLAGDRSRSRFSR